MPFLRPRKFVAFRGIELLKMSVWFWPCVRWVVAGSHVERVRLFPWEPVLNRSGALICNCPKIDAPSGTFHAKVYKLSFFLLTFCLTCG